MIVIAATILSWEQVACATCKADAPDTTCYSCGCNVCPTEGCSAKVKYLGHPRRLCLGCIDMRSDESPELAEAAALLLGVDDNP